MQENIQHSTWSAAFENLEKSLNGEAQSPLHQLRRSAFTEFTRSGFPTTRNEEWRFTNVAPIAKTEFKIFSRIDLPTLSKSDIEPFLLPNIEHTLVFVNGYFVSELSTIATLPKGVVVQSLSSTLKNKSSYLNRHLGLIAPQRDNAFNALNTAFIQDGLFVQVDDGIAVEERVHCLFLATEGNSPFAVQPRNLILAGKNSSISLIETYAGLGKNIYLTNSVTEVFLNEQSNVHHTKVQHESENAYHISTIHAHQQSKSVWTTNSIVLGGAIVRNNVISKLDGEFIECTLNGLSLGTHNQLIDNHTTIDHAKPNCVSHELYKAILDKQARGVFNGKIFVRRDAQKTDAKQTNKTLLLSDDATIDTKPQLEIFADDVKCTHGATVGQLDETQIFYLRSRGIGTELARDILTTAFANDVINRIGNKSIQDRLYTMIFERLHEGRIDTIAP